MSNVTWHGCYADNWRDAITDESFAHPAKAAKGLLRRIFDELALPRGAVVVDAFGGVGTTGIEAASRGCRAFLCELEPRFVEMARANFRKHRRTWEAFGDPLPVIVQGDSRRLREVLGPVMADAVVGSPPYAECDIGAKEKRDGAKRLEALTRAKEAGATLGRESLRVLEKGLNQNTNLNANPGGYGSTPGQLGSLPAGSVDAVVGSPPYADQPIRTDKSYDDAAIRAAKDNGITAERATWGSIANGGQLNYGDTPGQLGSLPAGSVGNQTGDTFWAAAAMIVAECFAILKPGGRCVWICKDFVRKGKRVPFSADWLRLCESVGFVLETWVHASLVSEERHPGLFDGPVVKRKERKSFFRRLAEKNGSPSIDHEDVLFLRRRARRKD